MYNKQNGGYILNRLKYLRTRKRKQLADEATDRPATPEQRPIDAAVADIEADLLFLKTVIYDETNHEEVIRALKSTRARRFEMAHNQEIDLLREFPYFFTNPKLV